MLTDRSVPLARSFAKKIIYLYPDVLFLCLLSFCVVFFSQCRPLVVVSAVVTHAALALGHIHGVLNIRWNNHLVVFGLPLLLLKLLMVQFLLAREKGDGEVLNKTKKTLLQNGHSHFST